MSFFDVSVCIVEMWSQIAFFILTLALFIYGSGKLYISYDMSYTQPYRFVAEESV